MKLSVAQKKLNRLELEIKRMRRILLTDKPDLHADEKVWHKVKKDVKQARARVFRRWYGQ